MDASAKALSKGPEALLDRYVNIIYQFLQVTATACMTIKPWMQELLQIKG